MPKGKNWTGTLIEGSRCPECNMPMVYNGNYWCSECPYVMPQPLRKKTDKHAFNVAYVLLMQQRGKAEEIDLKALHLNVEV